MLKTFFFWILKVFVTRVTETSTWIGMVGLALFILNFNSLLFLFLIFAIFMPETWWDKNAKIHGDEFKNWLEKTQAQ